MYDTMHCLVFSPPTLDTRVREEPPLTQVCTHKFYIVLVKTVELEAVLFSPNSVESYIRCCTCNEVPLSFKNMQHLSSPNYLLLLFHIFVYNVI